MDHRLNNTHNFLLEIILLDHRSLPYQVSISIRIWIQTQMYKESDTYPFVAVEGNEFLEPFYSCNFLFCSFLILWLLVGSSINACRNESEWNIGLLSKELCIIILLLLTKKRMIQKNVETLEIRSILPKEKLSRHILKWIIFIIDKKA